ncbi:protein MAL2 [Aplochiton taeniatus]
MSEPAANPAATSFPAPTIALPLGLDILRTYSGALICLEILFGGLVWILVASSNVPVPLLQGWVMFVSVTSFILSSSYLLLFITGLADRIQTDWNFMDVFYHFLALLFYFAAFVLEAATTAANGGIAVRPATNSTVVCMSRPSGNVFTFLDRRQYSINVVATIFSLVVTLLYGCSMIMGFKRWRK